MGIFFFKFPQRSLVYLLICYSYLCYLFIYVMALRTIFLQNLLIHITNIEGKLLHNIVLVSAIHQHESTIGLTCVLSVLNLPSISHPFPLLQVVTEPQFEFPESYSKFPLVIYFTHGGVYAFMLISPFIPPTTFFSSPMSIILFSMSESPLLPCKQVYQYHLSRFHLYALMLIYNIYFFLSDSFWLLLC